MSADFNGAAGSSPSTPLGPITTKAELDARIEARPTPKPEPQLTPNTFESAGVNQSLNGLAEWRIQYLQDRLQSSRDKLERDHALSRLRGKPRADFGRSR